MYSIKSKGFTLIELLVVISIVSLLISILLPALGASRRAARVTVCSSKMRQIGIAQNSYASDNDAFLPSCVTWGTLDKFHTVEGAESGGWMEAYFQDPKLLRCPDESAELTNSNNSNYVNGTKKYAGSYLFVSGQGDLPKSASTFYGWAIYRSANGSNQYRSPIPNIEWAGRTISGYGKGMDYYGPIALDQPSIQAVFTDAYSYSNSSGWVWTPSGLTYKKLPNNHSQMHGLNIAYVDGHVSWKDENAVLPRFKYYYGYVYW
jgi:prepilin-type N-terminal cleavage/methylation domain-containing protein/prepilin-type processing-associated H-X9-DG protein